MGVLKTNYLVPHTTCNHVNRGLINLITDEHVPTEISHDLLNARTIGQADYEATVKYHFLKDPSVAVPKRKRKLLTIKGPSKRGRKKSKADEEKMLITFCTKKAIAWATQHEQGIECIGKQFIEEPRALVDPDGQPTKGQKRAITQTLSSRYTSLIKSDLPSWTPEIAILDGMFLINVKPLGNTFEQYTNFLLRRYVANFYTQGTLEVHIIFDKQYGKEFNPKQWEQSQRDQSTKRIEDDQHVHISNITDTTQVPSNWRALLGCRKCKHQLLLYLSESMLNSATKYIAKHEQKLITAGPADPRSCNRNGHIRIEHKYQSECIESDSRLWRHSTKCGYSRQLIYCPDTDAYMIGLTNHTKSTDIVVELTPIGSKDRKLLPMNELTDSLERDPDLSLVPSQDLPAILQALYVSTGCDYISFFYGLGKSGFWNSFCRYSDFICGSVNGSIANSKSPEAYLSFFRLVGTAYFLKYRSTYRGTKSPVTLFNSCSGSNAEEQHIQWLDKIRAHVWEEVQNEYNLPPSHTALKLHWLRSVWILNMWSQSSSNEVTRLSPMDYGWNKSENGYKIQYDTDEQVLIVKQRVSKFTKGCKCKSGCRTKRCGCIKQGLQCGPGCRCLNCENLLTSGDTDIDIASEVEIRATSDSESDSDSEYEESNDYCTFDTDSTTDSENDLA